MSLARSIAPVVMFTALAVTASPADAQVRTFNEPTYGGYAISYCGAASPSCGEAVATAWCRSQSYEFASEWAASSGADDAVTVRIEDGNVCRGSQCDSFASITCNRRQAEFRMPRLGALGRATIIEPGRRGAVAAYEAVEFKTLIPGCHQNEPGVYLCETTHEYQHCRTLMQHGQVFSCRAGLAFDGGFAIPIAPKPGEYDLALDSDLKIMVEHGNRGAGRAKGDARVEVTFRPPVTLDASWCLQRDRYIYYPTGPKGGIGEIDNTAACDAPIRATVAPHEDDVLVAWELCNAFAAWGSELEHTADLMVGALFTLGSASPAFADQYGGSSVIMAPYLTVRAPVTIECRE